MKQVARSCVLTMILKIVLVGCMEFDLKFHKIQEIGASVYHTFLHNFGLNCRNYCVMGLRFRVEISGLVLQLNLKLQLLALHATSQPKIFFFLISFLRQEAKTSHPNPRFDCHKFLSYSTAHCKLRFYKNSTKISLNDKNKLRFMSNKDT